MAERPEFEDLLRPTLAPDVTAPAALYSSNALFLTAFFGGAFALLALAALNVQRLGRVRRDAGYLLLGFALTIALVMGLYRPGQEWSVAGLTHEGSTRLIWRSFALLLAVGAFLVHRRYYRSMSLVGLEPPSPWKAAIGCCVLGFVAQVAAVTLVRL